MASLGPVSAIAEDRSVDLSSVERELRRLWHGASGSASDARTPITRVCTLNLVAVAPDARSAARVSEAGAAITARYPCRVIIATADIDGPDSLDASISAYCHSGGAGTRPICCERVSLFASGSGATRLPLAILPLLASDVPVFVWISGDPNPVSPLFETLAALADRLVTDLQSVSHPERLIHALLGYSERVRPAPTDLAWRRTAFWRELAASIFDPPPLRSLLPSLTGVEIGFAAGGGGWQEAQALLLAAWFCERLDWKPEGRVHRDAENLVLEVSTRVGLGQVVLVPAPDAAAPPGEIASIQFPASERCSASFVARRVPAGELVELEVVRPDAAPVSWRRPLDARDTAWLLGQELERPHGSAAFVRALRLLASILPDDDPL